MSTMKACYSVTLVLFSILILMPLLCAGQSLVPAMNPVIEGSDFMGNCTRPTGTSPISVRVNGVPGLAVVNYSTQTPIFTAFTFPNITRSDNGTVFTCVVPPGNVIASLTLVVLFSPSYTAGNVDEDVRLGLSFSRSWALEANPDVGNNFTWTKNGMTYTGNVSATSIHIPVFTKADAGIYTVTAKNFLGSATASFAVYYEPELESTNGKLIVSWSFGLTAIVVACPNEEESGSGLFITCASSNNTCSNGMTVLPTGSKHVTAGMNYSCTVTTTNKFNNVQHQKTNYVKATSGIPSIPMITDATAGILQFIVKVKLYGGHTSLNFNVSVIDEQNTVTHVSATQTNVTSELMNYTIVIPFTKSGQYRFAVTASNPFGRSAMNSVVYPPLEIDGLEVIIPSSTHTIPTVIIPSSTHISTPTIANENNSISLNFDLIIFIIGIIIAGVVLIACLVIVPLVVIIRKKKCKNDNIQSVTNEFYGVMRVELKDNVAYSLVQTSVAQTQSIEVKENVTIRKAIHVCNVPSMHN